MSDDLKSRVKELKKRFENEDEPILELELNKMDKSMEIPRLNAFTGNLLTEIKKSSTEGKYLSSVLDNFEGLEAHQIRFIIEKSCDRYEALIGLMDKYRENFDDEEYNKLQTRFTVLNKVLTFMLEEHIGEYSEKELKK